ncbi:hypothetical protein ACTXT7_013597 [Hymenolepis weldensis]
MITSIPVIILKPGYDREEAEFIATTICHALTNYNEMAVAKISCSGTDQVHYIIIRLRKKFNLRLMLISQ